MNLSLGTLKRMLNNIESRYDDCIVEISFDSEYLGIIDKDGKLIEEIRIQNYKT